MLSKYGFVLTRPAFRPKFRELTESVMNSALFVTVIRMVVRLLPTKDSLRNLVRTESLRFMCFAFFGEVQR